MKTRYKIVLSSNSPRRKELLAGLDIPFTVRVLDGIDEAYPTELDVVEIPKYIAREKAAAYDVAPDELVVTADTIVALDGQVMGKPRGNDEACSMLRQLSGRTHQVVTGVCLTTMGEQRSFSVVSEVTFKHLSDSEIDYYVSRYKPFDKAGAYGIQEWIG